MSLRFVKTHKYRAKPVEIDGIRFDSTAEGARYCELRLAQKAGQIRHLVIHPRFKLTVNAIPVCVYVADFSYLENGLRVVEDVKGVKTPAYVIKKKLMRACHGIEIRETGVRR
jgi:hypothetical protein